MISVVLQNPSVVALWTLQSGSSKNPDLSGEHTPSPVRSGDPRQAYTLPPTVADVLLSFAEKTVPKSGSVEENKPPQPAKSDSAGAQHRTYKDLWHLIFGMGYAPSIEAMRDFDLGRDRDIRKVLATLPPYLARQFEASDGADLAEPRKIRLSDEDVGKDIVENILHLHSTNYPPGVPREVIEQWVGHSGDYDPNDPVVQALLNGTGRFIRGTDHPEIGYSHYVQKIYGPDPVTGETVEKGERSGAGINGRFIEDFEKKNPGLKIHIVYTYQDVALFIYPVSKSGKSSNLELTNAHNLTAPPSEILLRYRVTDGSQVS